MSDNHQAQQSNEQLKAQNLFAKWRKDETLYKEDEKNLMHNNRKNHHRS
ncbi:hypothetical protein [Staphylococcus pseudintermedius]|nr:hypothetical protein [Staphylococcus pseudintermedius]WIV35915.1 hypothetical protein QQZ05_05920 [Staphylococcus pseudintermedius]